MGGGARRRTRAARTEPDPRSAVLPELRPNLVRFDAAGRRADQDQVQRPFARTHQGLGAAVELLGLCESLRLPAGLAHESHQQVQRMVKGRENKEIMGNSNQMPGSRTN